MLALCAGVVPHFWLTRPNPHGGGEALSITVPLAAQPWPAPPGPRLAGVNSFGVSGSNAHLVLGKQPALRVRRFNAATCRVLLALSTQSAEALRDKVANLARVLGEGAVHGLSRED